MKIIGRILQDKRGVGAIEYALIASLVSVAAVAAFQGLGSSVHTKFANVDHALDGTTAAQ